jgi:hypothetical protein
MKEEKTSNQHLKTFFDMLLSGSFDPGHYFGGRVNVEPKPKYEQLGDGFELRPIDDGGYSHLYKDDKKVTSHVFRKGGSCIGFKDGYCILIVYSKKRKTKKDPSKYTYGKHVIINEQGKIVLEQEDSFKYPGLPGGNVAKIGDDYYNLLTGECIFSHPRTSINGKTKIILEHSFSFDHYKVKHESGIYSIDKLTCEITKIDEV